MSTNVAEKTKVNTRTLVQIGMLSALAIILMQFEIPLPFAPAFYKIDFSEVPVLIGCFSMGPFAGVLIELIKVILNVAIKGTMTMGIGDVKFPDWMCILRSSGADLSEKAYEEWSGDGDGSWNCDHDYSRMCSECLYFASGVCKSI